MNKIPGENPKSETRNPNQTPNPNDRSRCFGVLSFGFHSDFWFLVSGFILASIVSLPAISRAAVSLPLQGYFRSGRYMPVRVDPSTTRVAADGVLPTVIESRSDSVVPVLVVGSPGSLNADLPLHSLADDERLVAFGGDTQSLARSLFPWEKIVAIAVNSSDPLPGPGASWEALDAIILDSPAMARLDDAQRSVFLAAGTILAVAGDGVPDSRWPWKRRNSLWVLQCQPVGPVGEVLDRGVFSPTYAWAPGSSAVLRRQIFVAGALLGIAVVGIAMWRSKAAVGAIVFLAIIASGATIWWRDHLGIVDQAGGDIIVVSDSLLQRDSWLYERGRGGGVRRIDWSGSTHPVLASIAQIQSTQMCIVVSATGNPAFEYHAMAGETASFLRRDVRPGTAEAVNGSNASPMRELARDIYLTTGRRIAGEQTAVDGRWDTVVIESITPTSDR
jgi:hypothetical protein